MIRLFIDNIECDVPQQIDIPLDISSSNLRNVQSARSGRTIELELKGTPSNISIFGRSGHLYATKRFNAEQHTARIVVDGSTLLEGTANLLQCQSERGGDLRYRIRITGGGAEWAKQAAHDKVRDCGIEFSMRLTHDEIAKSWEGEQAVRFLPVSRNRYSATYTSATIPNEHIMTIDDYHPFISVKAVVERIFTKEGYTVESEFFDSELFRSLYFSGEYSSADTYAQRAKASFRARRQAPVTASADSLGRVFASPGVLNYSVGNVVDTANPLAVDCNGKTMSDTFVNNDVFFTDEYGYICFSPPSAMNVGFILHLEYETPFRILSRERLKGFDKVEFLSGVSLDFALTNTYIDFRERIAAAGSYKLFIFDFAAGEQYRLTIKDQSGNVCSTLVATAQSTIVNMPDTEGLTASCERLEGGSYVPYEGDWTLYESFIPESGTKQVSVDLRIPPQQMYAGEMFYFDKIFFGGADPGMEITLGTGCSLQPYFSTTPGYGSTVTFKDITHNNIWLIDLLDAVRQMFNLAIYTDTRQKRVYIEPMEELLGKWATKDWNNRIDASQPVVISDAGIDAPQWRVLKYRDGDKASEQFNAEHDTTLGRWCIENPLYGAVASTRNDVNPLFTTGVNRTGLYSIAPSASIMQVGDSNDSGSMETPFTTHIIRYMGMQPLPEGEMWGYPTSSNLYPLAGFHHVGDGENDTFSLCFEERDGCEGLHRYYDAAMGREAEGHYLTLTLRLSPLDVERLLYPQRGEASLMSLFRLTHEGEQSLFLLDRLQEYSPSTQEARCRFLRLTKDY
ncbi:MAG: hypothetical protein IJ348_06905 [Alistipes sp.]|nr:hypothetical protein [Alistipes sp.]